MNNPSPFQVVGTGRIGSLFQQFTSLPPVTRGHAPQDIDGPIYVCTRNDSLAQVIESTPIAKQKDLVFVQNGMIAPLLEQFNLSHATQALLYFAVQAIGSPPVDGGASVTTGPWSAHFITLCEAASLKMKELDKASFEIAMMQKLLWSCVFCLLSDVYDKTVGELCHEHSAEISELTEELLLVAKSKMPTLTHLTATATTEFLTQYSLLIPDYRGAVKEFEWRNGWFLKLELTPLHRTLMDRSSASSWRSKLEHSTL